MLGKKRRGFLPSRPDGFALEPRLVLSHGALATPALILNPVQQSPRAFRHLPAVDKVNRAFDQFTTDYLQAQQVYLASASSGLANADATFKDYTTQRVNLLTQELVQALVQLPGATTRLRPNQRLTPSMSTTLQSFLFRKINGTTAPTATNSYDNVSLLTALNAAVPTTSATSPLTPPAATLFTLKASSAIQTARINTDNAAYLMSSRTFQKHN
jgi:hypothetical protein